jgi:hypothetical protein
MTGNWKVLSFTSGGRSVVSLCFQLWGKCSTTDKRWPNKSSAGGSMPIWPRILMRSSLVRADKAPRDFSMRPSLTSASSTVSFPSTYCQLLWKWKWRVQVSGVAVGLSNLGQWKTMALTLAADVGWLCKPGLFAVTCGAVSWLCA